MSKTLSFRYNVLVVYHLEYYIALSIKIDNKHRVDKISLGVAVNNVE